ncbi:sex determination protein fruitless-like isoform X2 [Homalodisca vitripennis]|uniref:sex determination protein fruitless-like isoform X2 n=1 Tax=Homalodisca vitripennis TaxID=197043 RepID=UPI001EEB7953|nr:sex determination protein fruitless-like isoform X2 [Homalodisca vitripennis]XP_046676111.1 sex determination protein fruitless-like isoform X2 [Homalodisca vitripennis]
MFDMDQQFSLRWNNYVSQLTDAFGSLRYEEDLVDVTLSCEGGRLKAHKMLLSACSSYFRDIFKENPCQHPVIVFRNVKLRDLQAILDFVYKGEVNVLQEHLESFLGTAELLEIKGLTEGNGKEITLEEKEEECSGVTSKNGQRIVRERVQLDTRTASQLSPKRASARSKSPPVKKRRMLSSRTKPSERNQSEVEEETDEAPIDVKIEEEELAEELSFEEDEENLKMPLSPTSDPLHVPDDSQSSFVNLESSSTKATSISLKMGNKKNKSSAEDAKKERTRERELANAKNRRYKANLSEEKLEKKRQRDRERYHRLKQEKKIKLVGEMTEKEKKQNRKVWRKRKAALRKKNKEDEELLRNTPPNSDTEDLAFTERFSSKAS